MITTYTFRNQSLKEYLVVVVDDSQLKDRASASSIRIYSSTDNKYFRRLKMEGCDEYPKFN